MTPSEYQSLIDFLSGKFDRIDVRFAGIDHRLDGIDGRLTKVEVTLEGTRDDVKILAEAVRMNGERIDRLTGSVEQNRAAIERLVAS